MINGARAKLEECADLACKQHVQMVALKAKDTLLSLMVRSKQLQDEIENQGV